MADLRLPNINKVMLCGRITQDIELRYTPKGTPLTRFSLAYDRSYKDESGAWQKVAHFIEVVAWTKWAESLSNQAHKGSPVIIEGRLETRTYVDSNNNNRKVVEIVAEYIQFLESKFRAEGDALGSDDEVPLPKDELPQAQVTNDDVPF